MAIPCKFGEREEKTNEETEKTMEQVFRLSTWQLYL